MIELEVILIYLFILNIIGFLVMGMDKRKAKKDQWRIPERTLWIIAILGGAVGSLLGMRMFRHKTKHLAFVIGMPLLIVVHVCLAYYINGFLS